MLDFSMCQSGIDFKCPYSNRPLMPLTRLNAIFVLAVDMDREISLSIYLVDEMFCY
jgi:hypothetical protein